MKKRLSKIARDLHSNISLVAEFLRANGYDCEEDPNEVVSNEIAEIIHDNFPAFIAEKKRTTLTKTKARIDTIKQSTDLPFLFPFKFFTHDYTPSAEFISIRIR